MPMPAVLLLTAALLPLASFILLAFMGKRLGNPLAGWVATGLMIATLASSLSAMIAWYERGQLAGVAWGPADQPISLSFKWLPIPASPANPSSSLDLDIYVDSLTVAMFCTISVIALLVHVFAIGYMADARPYWRFFAFMDLFCFSALGLMLGSSLIQIFIFWLFCSISAYLLIAYAHERPPARRAAAKFFLFDSLGSLSFLIALGILLARLSLLSLTTINRWLSAAGSAPPDFHLPGGSILPLSTVTTLGILFAIAAIARCAQFPFHVWLPDSMEAPTPASALAHAVILPSTGIYLLVRLFPILTPDVKLFLSLIGLLTLSLCALIALAQNDVKKLLSFAACSQLGLIFLALGTGSWVGSLFHLVTFIFFQSLLLLSWGSVLGAIQNEQNIHRLGGLMKKLPMTAATFFVGVLAISGTPFTAAFYSRHLILSHAAAFAQFAVSTGHHPFYWSFFFIPVAVAYLTSFYMMRCWMLIFWGAPRDPALHEDARESATLWIALISLAGISLVGSQLLDIKTVLAQSIQETQHAADSARSPTDPPFTGFAQAWPVDLDQRTADTDETRSPQLESVKSLGNSGDTKARAALLWSFAVGILLAFLLYLRTQVVPTLLKFPPLKWLRTWLQNAMYFDDMYQNVFPPIALTIARLFPLFDRYIADALPRLILRPFTRRRRRPL